MQPPHQGFQQGQLVFGRFRIPAAVALPADNIEKCADLFGEHTYLFSHVGEFVFVSHHEPLENVPD